MLFLVIGFTILIKPRIWGYLILNLHYLLPSQDESTWRDPGPCSVSNSPKLLFLLLGWVPPAPALVSPVPHSAPGTAASLEQRML